METLLYKLLAVVIQPEVQDYFAFCVSFIKGLQGLPGDEGPEGQKGPKVRTVYRNSLAAISMMNVGQYATQSGIIASTLFYLWIICG